MADMQGLTDNGSTPEKVSKFLFDVVADYLAVGIDPKLSTLCLQSALPALSGTDYAVFKYCHSISLRA